MRWNVVIGGQLMSKSEQGVVSFHPEWIAKEGIISAIIIMVLPLIILFILSKVFPFWLPAESESSPSK
jgi:predicted membrane protein